MPSVKATGGAGSGEKGVTELTRKTRPSRRRGSVHGERKRLGRKPRPARKPLGMDGSKRERRPAWLHGATMQNYETRHRLVEKAGGKWSPERLGAHKGCPRLHRWAANRWPRQLSEVAEQNGKYFSQVSSKSGQGAVEKTLPAGDISQQRGVTFPWRARDIESSPFLVKLA